MTELSEEDRRRVAAGESAALHKAYDLYGDRLYRTALHVLGQAADAEDAVQDLFLGLPAKISGFSGRSRLSTWLYRMTVNHCLNQRKRRARGPRLLDDEAAPLVCDAPSPAAAASRADEQAHVRALLARLPERDRAILVLREIEQLSYREIADVLEVPEGTVMSRLSRARERFAEVATRHASGAKEMRG